MARNAAHEASPESLISRSTTEALQAIDLSQVVAGRAGVTSDTEPCQRSWPLGRRVHSSIVEISLSNLPRTSKSVSPLRQRRKTGSQKCEAALALGEGTGEGARVEHEPGVAASSFFSGLLPSSPSSPAPSRGGGSKKA
eukprot:CAMPEP_0177171572 /NCGR_PEP_ID=MMETSP0367-20130122/10681_1 /TAXON_ID=447022 ORGANISM="Scrippsiella hangoei-like, Strain SHHI-4" /NCGR_SAMPLE_ID=MMETSP0367 /ASSEMBLY_ACC=CAM_ASM_000362 /LENGTH=138 /DNA_ID=CAMNT_0018617801 /DNA_START=353 /DNA_END=770 /DNA_ORIENTATION=-